MAINSVASLQEHVASSQEQDVFVFELGARYANIQKELADTKLKLKVRMDDRTVLKSKFRIPAEVSSANDCVRVSFNAASSFVYEGARSLHIELCKHCTLGFCQSLATCQVPFEKVFSAAEKGETAWNLELKCFEKVVATLVLDIGILTSRLEEVTVPQGCNGVAAKLNEPSLSAETEKVKTLVNAVDSMLQFPLDGPTDNLKASSQSDTDTSSTCTGGSDKSVIWL